MADVMPWVRKATARAASGPLSDAVVRPAFERVAASSPFEPGAGLGDYIARFKMELEALDGKVYGPVGVEGAAKVIVELLLERRAYQVLSWDEEALGCPGLGERLERSAVRLVPGQVTHGEDRLTQLDRLSRLEVGLTGAIAGLADTGSLLVASAPGHSRLASLLPPAHVAVLPVSGLYPSLAECLADGGDELLRHSANVVVITGPSRTADIELTLALGMHGPRELHVILYDDRGAG